MFDGVDFTQENAGDKRVRLRRRRAITRAAPGVVQRRPLTRACGDAQTMADPGLSQLTDDEKVALTALLKRTIAAFAVFWFLGSVQSLAQNAYIGNSDDNTVSVIATRTNSVIATIPLTTTGNPFGVAVNSDGSRVFVTNSVADTVSVIATAPNSVISTISVDAQPAGVAVTPDGNEVYVANQNGNNVLVIDTTSNSVIAGISVSNPFALAVTPDGSKVYVSGYGGYASVIVTATKSVTSVYISGGGQVIGVAVTPDGSKVYIPNYNFKDVSVIDTATDTLIDTFPVGLNPTAFGLFIGPTPRFVGTPGKANCHGQSVSALAKQYGGLSNAAAASGFDSVNALQGAIQEFCAA